VRIHTHIGSGSDPAVWQRVSGLSLDLCRAFASVETLNLGGGYKVARMAHETGTDLGLIGAPVRDAFLAFAAQTGRRLRLVVEPGTFLLANSCSLLSTVQDMASTSSRAFLKLDTGMTEVLRPSLCVFCGRAPTPCALTRPRCAGTARSTRWCWCPRPARRAAAKPRSAARRDRRSPAAHPARRYVVVGHCCESGDLLSPAPGEPETIAEREMEAAAIGDLCVVEGRRGARGASPAALRPRSGAYCSGMATKNYNSFPEAAEVMRDAAGRLHLIRERQQPAQIWQNERPLPEDAVC